MTVINGFITDKESLEISIQPGDALANSVNPGLWETKSPAVGGSGIEWSSAADATLEVEEQYIGTVCKVTPKSRPSTILVLVKADISTDKGVSYKPYVGYAEIQFVALGAFTQLAIESIDAAVAYKRTQL